MNVTLPAYTISYEADGDECGTDIVAVNIHGHGHGTDLIETLLAYLQHEGYLDGGSWDIREDHLRHVPGEHMTRHVYSGPGRGARPVTVVERTRFWGWWCYRHPYEPATSGAPATQIIDGEALVEARLALLNAAEEPRPDVHAPRHGMPGYIYMCRDCAHDHYDRLNAARREALATLKGGS